jgi:hypothetical protein
MLITVAETTSFTRRAEQLLSAEERLLLINFLAANPTEGDLIPGLGGIRKVRFAAKGKGKSGGARVIYYYHDDNMPLHALLIYGKGERTNLSPEQRKMAVALVNAIKLQRLSRRATR